MELTELFSLVGAPFRFLARILLIFRYVFDGHSTVTAWKQNRYALARFGPSYRYRIWLLFDIDELEQVEKLINTGTNEQLLKRRDAHIYTYRFIAVVGALLSQAAISALSLPLLQETFALARIEFTMSLVISLLAIFFTCIEQRSLGFLQGPDALRAWLSNGIRYTNADGEFVYQSSMAAHQLLESSYELLGISITLFVTGLGVYLGSAWARLLPISPVPGVNLSNLGLLIAFVAGTGFVCLLFGYLVGRKTVESRRCLELRYCERRHLSVVTV